MRAADAMGVRAQLSLGDSIRWRPKLEVDKFTDDAVMLLARRLGRTPTGTELIESVLPREHLEVAGNLLTTAGLNRLTSLLIGAGGQALTNTATRIGVGNSATAEAVGQTDLQAAAGAANRQFKVMDATYPQQANGVVTARSTFATGEANFVWAEWGLDIGTPTVADGTTVNAVLLNRKVQAMGTKASGSWVATATVTFT